MGYMDNFETSLTRSSALADEEMKKEMLDDRKPRDADVTENLIDKDDQKHKYLSRGQTGRYEDKSSAFNSEFSIMSADTRIVGKIISNGNLLIGGDVGGHSGKGRCSKEGQEASQLTESEWCSVLGNIRRSLI